LDDPITNESKVYFEFIGVPAACGARGCSGIRDACTWGSTIASRSLLPGAASPRAVSISPPK
jgi:hypothetical protein